MLDKTLPPVELEVSPVTQECPNPTLWHCYDGVSTEVEVLAFLQALVTMLKPEVVVETGTFRGYGSYYLARGLEHNGFGQLHTTDPDTTHFDSAKSLIQDSGLEGFVSFYHETGEALVQHVGPIDLAFLDSDCNTRIGELVTLLPHLTPWGVVVVHDTSTFHDANSGIRSRFLAHARANDLQAFNFDTPRGLMLLRRL